MFKLSLRQKVNFAILTIFATIAVIFTVVQVSLHQHHLKFETDNVKLVLEKLVERDKERFAREIFNGRTDALLSRVKEVSDLEGIICTSIFDKSGTLLVSTREHSFDPSITLEFLVKTAGQPEIIAFGPAKQKVLVFTRSLGFPGENNAGYILIYYSLAKLIKNQMTSTFIFAGLMFTTLVAMLFLLNMIMSKAIHEPIMSLMDSSKAIVHGDYDSAIPVGQADEIGELSESFNQMRLAVKEKIYDIEQIKERYRRLYQQAPAMLCTVDGQGRIVEVNNLLLETIGVSREKLIGCRSFEFFPSEEKVGTLKFLKKILKDADTAKSRPYQIIACDGVVLDTLVSVFAQKDLEGKIVQATLSIQDITEKIRAEKSLRESEHQLRMLTDNMVDVITWTDPELNVLYVSPSVEKVLGISPKEFIGKSAEPYVHPDDVDKLYKISLKARERKKSILLIEYRQRHANGQYLWVESAVRLLYDASGKSSGAVFVTRNITEQKQMAQAIKESEERLDLALEGASQGIWDLDLREDILYLDARSYTTAGYEPDEFPGTFDELEKRIHKDDLEYVRSTFLQYLSGDLENYEAQCRFLRKDGTYMWILSKGKIVSRDEQGNPTRFIGITTDITELKSAEDALRQNEELLGNILESMNDGVLVLDHALEYRVFNKAMESVANCPRDEVFGKTPWEAFPYIADTDVEQCIRKALKGVSTENLEIQLFINDDESVWHRDSFSPLKDKNGNVVGVVGVVVDISEQKQIEESLRESEARFKALHNASFGGICIHDHGVVLECNQGLSDLTGYPLEELIGMDGLLLIAEQSREDTLEKIRSGYEKPYEVMARHKDGNAFPVRLEARNVPYKGRIVRSVEFRDITEEKKAEQEREELHSQLIQAQKMESIGRLAGGVAHDLNNWLVPVLGYTEMLLENKIGTDSRREKLQSIYKAGVGARNLVTQLLAFSRKQTLKVRPVDMDKILLDFKPLLCRTIREDIKINIVSPPGAKLMMADQTQLEQIIMNLSVNAADAMPDGGVLTIETNIIQLDETNASQHPDALPGPYVFIGFTDTGCGMDEETRNKIFEPFYSTKAIEKGTGLGLATVYGIVKQHKGHIWVHSEVNKGSVFNICFPHVQGRQVKSQVSEDAIQEPGGSEKILLAEDNEGARNLTADILIQNGYTVLSAQSGNQALEMWASTDESVDLLITDVIMPGMNGKELYESLHSLDPDIKVIYISGYPDNAIAHHGVIDHDVQYIQKPFNSKGFLFKIRQVLDGNKTAG